MDIELSHVTPAGIPIRGRIKFRDEEPGDLPTEAVRFPDPIEVDGLARRVGDLYVVEGRIAGHGILECARCLADVDTAFDVEFTARFAPQSLAPRSPLAESRRQGGAEDVEDDSGVRLGKDDLDVSFLPATARVLVIDEVVREQVLLELPLRSLCKVECRGLCPKCGVDLNAMESDCGCGHDGDIGDLRLAALAEIKKKLDQ